MIQRCIYLNLSLLQAWNYTTTLYPIVEEKRLAYHYLIPAMLTLCAVCLVLNALVLATAQCIRGVLSNNIRLILGLAVADAWTTLLIALGLLVNSYLPVVHQICFKLCYLFTLEALRLGSIMTCVLLLLVIAINHRMAVSPRCGHRNPLPPPIISFVILLLFVFPAALFLGVFASLPGQAYQSPGCKNGTILDKPIFRQSVFMFFLAPLVALAAIYISMAFALSRLAKKISFNRRRESCQSQSRKYRRTVTTAIIIVGSFLIAFIPCSILYLVTCPTCIYAYHRVPFKILLPISALGNVLMISKGIINPIVYAFRIPEFKQVLGFDGRRSEGWATNSATGRGALVSRTCSQRKSANDNGRRVNLKAESTKSGFVARSSARDLPELVSPITNSFPTDDLTGYTQSTQLVSPVTTEFHSTSAYHDFIMGNPPFADASDNGTPMSESH